MIWVIIKKVGVAETLWLVRRRMYVVVRRGVFLASVSEVMCRRVMRSNKSAVYGGK